MPGLKIDFAAPARRNSSLGWVVLGIGCAVAVAVGVLFHRVAQESGVIEARLDALGIVSADATTAAAVDPARAARLRKQVEGANRIVTALEKPWIRLLDDIEASSVRGVALLGFDSDADKLNVRLSGEAVDRDSLSRYLERLGAAASLQEVRLSQHEWQQRAGANALRFVVTARWVPPK